MAKPRTDCLISIAEPRKVTDLWCSKIFWWLVLTQPTAVPERFFRARGQLNPWTNTRQFRATQQPSHITSIWKRAVLQASLQPRHSTKLSKLVPHDTVSGKVQDWAQFPFKRKFSFHGVRPQAQAPAPLSGAIERKAPDPWRPNPAAGIIHQQSRSLAETQRWNSGQMPAPTAVVKR